MRQNIDIDMIKRRTIQGQIEIINKQKQKDVEERVRVSEETETQKIPSDGNARTRNQLLELRREQFKSHNTENFK